MNSQALYLSITHYNDPKKTVFRKVHTSILSATTPLSLHCEIKENKYKDFNPIQHEVFVLDLFNNTITPLVKDLLEPPTDKQVEYMKIICEYLGKSFNLPKSKEQAKVWLEHYVPIYKNELNAEAAYYYTLHEDAGDRL